MAFDGARITEAGDYRVTETASDLRITEAFDAAVAASVALSGAGALMVAANRSLTARVVGSASGTLAASARLKAAAVSSVTNSGVLAGVGMRTRPVPCTVARQSG